MYVITGDECKKVDSMEELIEIANEVKDKKKYGTKFKIEKDDYAYLTYSQDLKTRYGELGGFCLLYSEGRGYKALHPYAYKSVKSALNALLNF